MEHPNTNSNFQNALAGSQMLFVAFGAMVLMPILTGLEPSVAMFGAGIGTLLFQLVSKRMVPVFPASSFAFIAPIFFSIQTWGMAPTAGGLIAVGFVYLLLGQLARRKGTELLEKVLPPVVVGPVIMVIAEPCALRSKWLWGKQASAIELFPYQDALRDRPKITSLFCCRLFSAYTRHRKRGVVITDIQNCRYFVSA